MHDIFDAWSGRELTGYSASEAEDPAAIANLKGFVEEGRLARARECRKRAKQTAESKGPLKDHLSR